MYKPILCKQSNFTYECIEITYQVFHIRIIYYGCAYIILPNKDEIKIETKNEYLNSFDAEKDINKLAREYIDNFIKYIINVDY